MQLILSPRGICKFVTVVALMFSLLFPTGRALAAYPVLSVGSRGEAVVRLQQELKRQGYYTYWQVTGYYGPITRDAVMRFQKANGLVVDGVAGPATQSVLYGNGYRTLKFGMRGLDVSRLQSALKQQGYFYANVTGYYGKVTENAVIAFQKAKGLRIDGIAGPQTQRVLFAGQASSQQPVSRGDALSRKVADDLFWLARIIHAEAAGEPYIGKVAVGNVIMNRVKSPGFPNTVYGVIFEYYKGIPQFSPVQDGTIYNTPSGESYRAAQEAYYGLRPVGDALYFFNPAKASGSWIVRNRTYITTIGNHVFYR
ncbi:N-acetylmuramoyl-L-alanine amidase [Caldicoprobacter guelmensis]|uniref:peptidoglycan-binding protein n=1 Tax=Caldicoprobacter guelmensis TaxID=1170224 RepID=UPI0019572CA8|nr:peptidoglycan-binding protein [Caldicoprobacter guelmensis]MBM7582270.1 N-acetylmuramoyl-L-alanine amidase [Caldicoprobacter guelmensis]